MQVISIMVVNTDIGKLKKYNMLDLKIELKYFEPQGQSKPRAVVSIEPAYSVFDKKLLFIAGGQCGSYLWKNDVYIYDIENRK